MGILDVDLGDVYYVPNKRGIARGVVIEVSLVHSTVLLKGLPNCTSGNFGAHVSELYKSEREAYKAYKAL